VRTGTAATRETVSQAWSPVLTTAGVGGITLARDARLITLLDIYEAVSEEDAMFRLHKGSPSACPVGGKIKAVLAPRFAHIQNDFKKSLSSVSLADLLSDLG